MKDKTKKWLAVAGLLAVCAVLVFGISRVLYHEPDREAQAVERESEETELFVETETPEPAPAESTEAEMEEPLVIETETGTSVNDREQEIQETPEKTEAEKPSEPPALSEGTATDQPDTPPSYEEEKQEEPAPAENQTPKTGDTKDGMVYVEGFGWITDEYDLIVIFNSDNHIVPNALSIFNNAYYSGCDSIQAHRIAENLNTSIAVLNATSEEINNNLFRLAHTRMGFSSALIGSAMAFDFAMFHERAPKLKGSDISKAMETVLLEQNIYTEYLAEVVCYSKKEDNADGYQTQRISWIRSQYTSTFFALRYLPLVLLKGEWDYALKLFQWLMPSRFLLIALILLCTAGITLLNWTWAPKWYVLLATLILAFLMALPEGEVSRRLRKAIWALPVLMFTAVFSHIKRFFYKKK